LALNTMAEALTTNRTLTHLHLSRVTPTRVNLSPYMVMLGKCPSIMETYNANHTIKSIELNAIYQPFVDRRALRSAPALWQLMEWNNNTTHRHYARCRKIIAYHFGPRLDVEKFKGMSESLLCSVADFFDSCKRNGVEEELVNVVQRRFYFDMLHHGLLLPV